MRVKLPFFVLVAFMVALVAAQHANAQISSNFSGAGGGAVIVGASTTTCNGSAEGGLRYNDTKSCIEYCDASAWTCTSPFCASTGLVGRWKLNESSGTTASDETGSHNGTLTNMTPASDWVAGKFGNALDFDGSNDYVQTTASIKNQSNYTVAGWVKLRDVANPQIILWQGDSAANGYGDAGTSEMHIMYAGNMISAFLGADSTTSDSFLVNHELDDTTSWYHVAAVFKNLTTSPTLDFYVDGVLRDTDTATVGEASSASWDTNFRMARPGLQQRMFNGQLDDVYLYNTALTAQQVLDLYHATLSGKCLEGGGGVGGGSCDTTPTEITSSGSHSYEVPAGCSNVVVELWGGGGGAEGGVQGDGGGGGAYSMKTVSVTGGNSYSLYIGAGGTENNNGSDSYFINTSTVLAKGGTSGAGNNQGGQASAGIGDTKYSGGNGANGTTDGGGGGGAAGSGANGGNGSVPTGGTAGVNGGNGGNGGVSFSGGNPGIAPGGGGGGSDSFSQSGGSGANGKAILTPQS